MTFVEQLKIEHAKVMKAEAAKAIRAAKKSEEKKLRLQANALRASMKAKSEDKSMLTEDEMHWTDASKYAKQYYGETFHETTRHDTDWGDY